MKNYQQKSKIKNIQMQLQTSTQVQGYSSFQYFRIDEQVSQIRSYNPLRSDDLHEFKSQLVVPLSQKKSNTNSIKNQDEKSFIKNQLDLSELSMLQNKPMQKHPIIVKSNRSLIPELLTKKVKSQKTQIIVYYFNTTRKLVFTTLQLTKKFILGMQRNNGNKELGLIKNLIPYLVKQYCKLYLFFEPLEVNHENFQLKIAGINGEDDPLVQPFSHQEEINWLFGCGNLVLGRKPKSYERLKIWEKNVGAEMEILEIIIPFQRQITQHIERGKTLNTLKQKIIACNQLGNIVIVTYTTFTVCEFKKKISEIVAMDRILQVYRLQASTYEDVQQSKPVQKIQKMLTYETIDLQPKQSRLIIDAEFEVNQNFYSGKLYIQILGTKIIEKYEGGFLGYLTSEERRVERSIHTLVGISCDKNKIWLKFLTKDGAETCLYNFQSKVQVENFFKCIMKIGRQLKQNFQKICSK